MLHTRNVGESPIGLLSVGGGGLVFCLSLWYTKSLWWAVGFNAGWDWGQSYLYGTPNGGLVMKGHLLAEHPAGTRSLLLCQLMHISSTGALVVFSPSAVSPSQETGWYALYGCTLWLVVVLLQSWGIRQDESE